MLYLRHKTSVAVFYHSNNILVTVGVRVGVHMN